MVLRYAGAVTALALVTAMPAESAPCSPLLDPKLKKRVIKEGLQPYLKDNTNAWEMLPEGNYRLKNSRTTPFGAQQYLMGVYGQEVIPGEAPITPA